MTVLKHVIESISPASAAHAEGARLRVATAGLPLLERLAAQIGGAQHTAKVRSAKRTIVVVAGDHGAGNPGIALGAAHPTVTAARAIADGTAALAQVARASHTPFVIVDAGAAESGSMPESAVQLGRGPTRDLLKEPAMTIVDASLALEQGIALAISLSESGLDLLAVGALGIGAEVSVAALLGATLGGDPSGAARGATLGGDPSGAALGAALGATLGGDPSGAALGATLGGDPSGAALGATGGPSDAALGATEASEFGGDTGALAAWHVGALLAGANPLEQLATLGGAETAILAGLMLGAASMNVPIILDGEATGAAALVATGLAPNVAGYLVAAHAGSLLHRRTIAHLGLTPIFDVGLGHGEGTGAAMVIPLVDQVAALAARD